LDAFASWRAERVAEGRRSGVSLSVDWPLWASGGMGLDAEKQRLLKEHTGMVPMREEIGLEAFYQALGSGHDRVLVVEGVLDRIQRWLFEEATAVTAVPSSRQVSGSAMNAEVLRDHTLRQCVCLVSETIGLAKGRIDPSRPLDRYGVDSIVVTQLNQQMEQVFGPISKTLFYEYQTLDSLAEHLSAVYPDACAAWNGAVIFEPQVAPAPLSSCQLISQKSAPEPANADPCEPIAVIGLSGHYPMAPTLEDFWKNLASGANCITEISQDRWPLDDFYSPDAENAVRQGKSYGKWGGFLESFADFDADFFSLSPQEALNMDPQERCFLQCAWESMEDAGYGNAPGRREQDTVGVFVGVTKTGYGLHGPVLREAGANFYPYTSFSSMANRVSYMLYCKGPSMPVDTMCSSSLTALHEACEQLRHGHCRMAIAGGVNLYLHPSNYVELSAMGLLSDDGVCRSFGKGGTGFVPGEGVGAVVLKTLSQAERDKDHIYAVIRATHVNHCGRSTGYTAPNPKSYTELIRRTLDISGLSARSVSCVEAHGTGTELGDAMEVKGMAEAFRSDTDDLGFCALGSVKSNLGHLEAASGIAGLTKIIMQMQHGTIVPSLHAEQTNGLIDFERTPFVLQRETVPWNRPQMENAKGNRELPRIAGLSSFGAGGANAHMLVEEYVPNTRKISGWIDSALIVLSARNGDRLRAYAASLANHLERGMARDENSREYEERIVHILADLLQVAVEDVAVTESFADIGMDAVQVAQLIDRLREMTSKNGLPIPQAGDSVCSLSRAWAISEAADSRDLHDVAFTLQVGREAMEERLALVAESLVDVVETLRLFADGEENVQGLHRGCKDNRLVACSEEQLDGADLNALAEYWVAGSEVDWTALCGDEQPHRLSLPTYPFAQRRYWLDTLAEVDPEADMSESKEAPRQRVTGQGDGKGFNTLGVQEKAEALVRRLVAGQLNMRPDALDVGAGFLAMGLESMGMVHMVQGLEKIVGKPLDPTLPFTHTTIVALAGYLSTHFADSLNALAEAALPPDKGSGQDNGSRLDERDMEAFLDEGLISKEDMALLRGAGVLS